MNSPGLSAGGVRLLDLPVPATGLGLAYVRLTARRHCRADRNGVVTLHISEKRPG